MLTIKDEAIRYGIKNNEVVKRFKDRLINLPDGCIDIDYSLVDKSKGYKGFTITLSKNKYVVVKTHRFAYALAYGFEALPAGYTKGTKDSLTINHKCRRPSCVNPEHMEVITNYENGLDGALVQWQKI